MRPSTTECHHYWGVRVREAEASTGSSRKGMLPISKEKTRSNGNAVYEVKNSVERKTS